jgi:hypothetical protein
MKWILALTVVALLAILLLRNARSRAEQQEAERRASRSSARRGRIPHVSANLRGIDATGQGSADPRVTSPRTPGQAGAGLSQPRGGSATTRRAPSSGRRRA